MWNALSHLVSPKIPTWSLYAWLYSLDWAHQMGINFCLVSIDYNHLCGKIHQERGILCAIWLFCDFQGLLSNLGSKKHLPKITKYIIFTENKYCSPLHSGLHSAVPIRMPTTKRITCSGQYLTALKEILLAI